MCLFLFVHLTIVYQWFYIWNLKRKYTELKILLRKRYFCPYDTMGKFHVLSFQKVGKFQNLYWLHYQKSQWNFIMFKFSALSQIWKKYIQKLNDWDLPLKSLNCWKWVTSTKWTMNSMGLAVGYTTMQKKIKLKLSFIIAENKPKAKIRQNNQTAKCRLEQLGDISSAWYWQPIWFIFLTIGKNKLKCIC